MKKKIGVIGDVHGRNHWKKFVTDNPDILEWIFIGDYVDSFNLSNVEILHNLKEIIEFKKENMDTVTLLLGNHDVTYIYDDVYGRIFNISGHRPMAHWDLSNLFNKNLDLFQMIHFEGNHIFSHAGLTNTWVSYYMDAIDLEFANICDKFKLTEKFTFLEKLNWLQHTEGGRDILFSFCAERTGDPSNVGGPIWVDRSVMERDMTWGYHQVVGHTMGMTIDTVDKDETTSVTFIDVPEEFLTLEL